MTNRLIYSLRCLFVLAAFSARRVCPQSAVFAPPEPRFRPLHEASHDDDWLFEAGGQTFSAEVFQLQQAMSRTTGALTQLRGLLSQIARHAPPPVATALPRFAFQPDQAADVRFDAERLTIEIGGWPDDDADLFEDVPNFFPRAARNQAGSVTIG